MTALHGCIVSFDPPREAGYTAMTTASQRFQGAKEFLCPYYGQGKDFKAATKTQQRFKGKTKQRFQGNDQDKAKVPGHVGASLSVLWTKQMFQGV